MTVVAAAPTAGSRLWVQWTLSNRGRSTVVSFAGEIDAANADHLVDTVGAVLETCRERLIVDLTAVGFVDAVGACALLRARQEATARSVHLDVVCAERVPRRVLTVPGDDEQIEFFGSVAEALGAQRSCELSGGAPTPGSSPPAGAPNLRWEASWPPSSCRTTSPRRSAASSPTCGSCGGACHRVGPRS